ncbi:deoxyribonuclease IV [Bifidobacterium avesanii]|uniref:Probable endonuclease 4 n=1 Tax=Bifidobacterium avesanii TaxID=1798157 RepID=A0A7K3THK0_9BIFI|nr:deoxyribonuclease IV [Bifidobacterium avesanii]KAB8287730.1 endonuclease IV [Bifidobacterium avesanii]NEG78189.1 deoxyribonuclease IV [Bifidobacterium avesanii]
MNDETNETTDATETTPGARLLVGSHLSASGGWKALIKRSHAEGGTTFAFFPRSPYGSRSKSLTADGAAAFGAQLHAEGYGPLVAHAPYVYNFAAKDESKRDFAVRALAEDLAMLAPVAAAGQAIYLNIHPGSHVGQGADEGIRLIGEGLNRVFGIVSDAAGDDEAAGAVPVLLETMAGKGTECGRSFEEIAAIIDHVDARWRAHVGVTLDTCHVYDAGYDLVNDFDGVLADFDHAIGLGRLMAVHANDSQFGFGSRKDRHANIGAGKLGEAFFARLVNDPRTARLPMVLETKELTETTHREEIALLRGLVKA